MVVSQIERAEDDAAPFLNNRNRAVEPARSYLSIDTHQHDGCRGVVCGIGAGETNDQGVDR